MRVFGFIRSYLVCVELIIDVFRKNKNFDEKIFFPMKNLKSWSTHFSRFFKILKFRKLFFGKEFWKSRKVVDQDLRFFIGKNIFSSKILFFLKTSLICSMHTKYEGITPKTLKVMMILRKFLPLPKKKTTFKGFLYLKKKHCYILIHKFCTKFHLWKNFSSHYLFF